MNWDACRIALESRLLTLPGLDPANIAWPNVVFDAQPGEIHYRVWLLPSDTSAAVGSNAWVSLRGIFQVSVYAPSGTGPAEAVQAADAVIAHFDRATLTSGGVTVSCGVPTPGPALAEAGWLHIPVSIRFQTIGG